MLPFFKKTNAAHRSHARSPLARTSSALVGVSAVALTACVATPAGSGSDETVAQRAEPVAAGWIETDFTTTQPYTPPSSGSITGFVTPWNDQQHIDYVGADHHIHEMVYETSWISNDLFQQFAPLSAPSVESGTRIAGYVTEQTQWVEYNREWFEVLVAAQQHVVYVGTDLHVYELMFDSVNGEKWNLTDLTSQAGAPAASPGTGLAAYASAQNGNPQQHVDYVGLDGLIHELLFDLATSPHWQLGNPMQGLAMPYPVFGSGLVGYVSSSPDPSTNQQHIDYVGLDDHVHELMFDGTRWNAGDLTQLSGGTMLPDFTTALTGYVTPWDGQQHVDFAGTDGHVHEMRYAGTWQPIYDLTNAASAPNIVACSLDAYVSSFNGNQQHVNFIGTDHQVWELVYAGNGWVRNNLSGPTGIATTVPGALTGFVSPWNSQEHVDFVRNNGAIVELMY